MMTNNIYAVITRYRDYKEYLNHPDRHDWIYQQMMLITDGDHEVSDDAASWCELASIGEVYEFREGKIEIKELV